MSKLPHGVLTELKCADCRSYLSQAPIKILPEGRGICGRCPSKTGIHSSTFEKLAGIFVYPCKYRHRGCTRALTFREVTYHESECSYMPSCCFCCKHPCQPCGSKPNDKDINGEKPIIADDRILSTLRCASCSNYLSSSPIFISPDGSDICFLCAQNVHPPLTRNTPLETILNAFVFQCRYVNYGCDNLFSFGAISIHESNCEFHYQRSLLEDKRNPDIVRNISRNESMRSDLNSPIRDNWKKINAPLMEELNAKTLFRTRNNNVIEEQPRMSQRVEPEWNQPRMTQRDPRLHRENSEMSQQSDMSQRDPRLHREHFEMTQRDSRLQREHSEMSQRDPRLQREHSEMSQRDQPLWDHLEQHRMPRESGQPRENPQREQSRMPYRENSQREQPRMSNRDSSQRMPYRDNSQPRMSNREQSGASQKQEPQLEQTKEVEEEEVPVQKPKGKIRGVVETPRGHIYATITPNSIVAFKPSAKKNDKYEHDEDSGRSSPVTMENRMGYNQMVQEFKVKQKHHAVPAAVQ